VTLGIGQARFGPDDGWWVLKVVLLRPTLNRMLGRTKPRHHPSGELDHKPTRGIGTRLTDPPDHLPDYAPFGGDVAADP
jgi:hypothetical protein